MSVFIKNLVTRLCLVGALVAAPISFAAPMEPQALVEQVTNELFTVAKANRGEDAKPEVFYGEVGQILDKVVDFRYIARAVMGKEGFAKASAEQRASFAEAFKGGLVKSYAKGIAGYADSDIKVVGATVSAKDPSRAVVRQEVTYEGNVHQLSYSMRLQKEEWKVINVILNGVNLGQSFSSQFNAAMRKEGGDVDKVVAGWLAES
jgi:phospholipid transport system substrate-binding protein